MKVSINIEKRYAYIIMGLLVLIAGGLFVYAANPLGDPGHPASQIGYSDMACGEICNDADTQDLSIDGQTLSLTNGGSVTLPSGGDDDWSTFGTNIYRVGKVGIGGGGVESPDAYLQISAPTSGNPPPTTPALIAGGGYEGANVVITNIGRVGIGTASPSSKLVVNGEIKASSGTKVYGIFSGCANAGALTLSTTCSTIKCSEYVYYDCDGDCMSGYSQTCNNVLKGYLIGVA